MALESQNAKKKNSSNLLKGPYGNLDSSYAPMSILLLRFLRTPPTFCLGMYSKALGIRLLPAFSRGELMQGMYGMPSIVQNPGDVPVQPSIAGTPCIESDSAQSSQGLTGEILQKFAETRDSMDARLRQYKTLYSGATYLDPVRLKYLESFAEYAQSKNISVIIFLPGYSKEFWTEMIQIEAFGKIHRSMDEAVHRIGSKYGWKIVDFRPDAWNGPELVFFDGVHPTKPTAQVIDTAIGEVIANDF